MQAQLMWKSPPMPLFTSEPAQAIRGHWRPSQWGHWGTGGHCGSGMLAWTCREKEGPDVVHYISAIGTAETQL
jgi:hypothetical protein